MILVSMMLRYLSAGRVNKKCKPYQLLETIGDPMFYENYYIIMLKSIISWYIFRVTVIVPRQAKISPTIFNIYAHVGAHAHVGYKCSVCTACGHHALTGE